MTGQIRQIHICTVSAIFAAVFAALLIMPGCKKKSPMPPNTEIAVSPRIRMSDVIRTARTWRPAYTSWYGKTAPDFTLADITGKAHKLSDYLGRDVILVFWATWCPPCRMEIPHLIELRRTVSKDKLALLAASRENPTLVKSFVIRAGINYTILFDSGYMPGPYSSVTSIPSSFFINPDGKIKLATVGILTLDSAKAILQAK